jgi:hypothetical protein
MTVSTLTTYNEAAAGGTVYYFTFRCDDAAWAKVYVAEVLKTTGIVVALNADQEASPGGSVTFSAAAAGVVRIQRETPLTQETNYTAYDAFPAETHEFALDKGVMQMQDAKRDTLDVVADALAAVAAEEAARIAADAAIIAAGTGAVVDLSACPVTATGSITARTLANRAADVSNVLDEGADSSGVADVAPAFAAAVLRAGTAGRVVVPAGVYRLESTVVLPIDNLSGFEIIMDRGATINFVGTGYCFDAVTAGAEAAVGMTIRGGMIVGTSAGAGGIRYEGFNGGRISDVLIRGFSIGDGIYLNNTNQHEVIGCICRSNLNGLHVVETNALRVVGGYLNGNSQWGLWQDGGWANSYQTTCEVNGNWNGGSPSGGNVFIQNGQGTVLDTLYSEYNIADNGRGAYNVRIGDATHQPQGTQVIGGILASSDDTTASIYDDGVYTHISGVVEVGTPSYFLAGGTHAHGRTVGRNASYADAWFDGVDPASDTLDFSGMGVPGGIAGDPAGLSMFAAVARTGGLGIHQRSGDLIASFNLYDGTAKAQVLANGSIRIGGGTASFPVITFGTGAPSDNTLCVGSVYLRLDGGATTSIYIKTGATTWTAK